VAESDILSDLRERLLAAGLDRHIVQRVVLEARQFWGGQQVYVQAVDRENRDAVIRAALEKGLSTEEAARRAGVSARTVRRRQSSWW
jgi:DNA invertase Pin-like site-specific DNA recombinase